MKIGDRIMKVGPANAPKGPVPAPGLQAFAGRDQFSALMAPYAFGTQLSLEVKPKAGAVKTVKVVLGKYPTAVPDELPDIDDSTARKALEKPKAVVPKPKDKDEPKKDEPKEPKKDDPKKKEAETGLIKRKNATLGREYWMWVPRNYDPNVAYGLVVWLHPAGREGRDADDMTDIWAPYCRMNNLIMVGPVSTNKEGWVAGEMEGVMKDVEAVTKEYTIDKQRVLAHGWGIGGQMAYYMGFNARDTIRAVVPVGAVLASQPKEPVPGQRLSFYVVAGEKDPLRKDIEAAKDKLTERKYPVVFREMKSIGKQYLNEDEKSFDEMMRWIDSLDKQ